MNIGYYGILVIFGGFILLMIFNPKFSCFGKKLASPLYPLRRKKKQAQRRIKTEDYGFDLGGEKMNPGTDAQTAKPPQKKIPTRDYGFSLGESDPAQKPGSRHEPVE